MTIKLKLGCFFIILLLVSAVAAAPRHARQVEVLMPETNVKEGSVRLDENEDTLRYENPANLPNILTIPDVWGFGDMYLNVRFTSIYAPFKLLEVHFPLYDLGSTPDLRVLIWESGEQNDVFGYPTEPIDSVLVQGEDLEFSPNDPAYNVIDLRELNIVFNDLIDFHIGINPVLKEEADSIGLYLDNGRYTETSRSGFWNGELEEWVKMHEETGLDSAFNLAIHAVIASDTLAAPIVLEPATQPATIIIEPAYPNPFNEHTRITFTVPAGEFFSASLFDCSGRRIRLLAEGAGGRRESREINFNGLPAGEYFLYLKSQKYSRTSSLMFIR